LEKNGRLAKYREIKDNTYSLWLRYREMGAAFFPVLFFTALWGGVGIAMPIMTPKGPHQNLIRCILMLTAACCWLFWLCCYMAQMNPLIGPKLKRDVVAMIGKSWNNPIVAG